MAVKLVLQSKGGSGKSTLAQQGLATYDLARFGKSKLIELDDENQHSDYLTETAIEAGRISLGNQPDQFHKAVSEAIPLDAENLVIDVGGNRTTTIVIEQLEMLTSRADLIDAIAIPVSDNQMGPINAEKTLKAIRDSLNGEELLAKCFIVLNRVRSDCVDLKDPSLQSRYRKVVNLIRRWKLPYAVMGDMDGVENLSATGRTVYEVHPMRKELVKEFTAGAKAAYEAGDKEKVVMFDDLQYAVNKSSKYFWPAIERFHTQLDGVYAEIAKKVAALEVEA